MINLLTFHRNYKKESQCKYLLNYSPERKKVIDDVVPQMEHAIIRANTGSKREIFERARNHQIFSFWHTPIITAYENIAPQKKK